MDKLINQIKTLLSGQNPQSPSVAAQQQFQPPQPTSPLVQGAAYVQTHATAPIPSFQTSPTPQVAPPNPAESIKDAAIREMMNLGSKAPNIGKEIANIPIGLANTVFGKGILAPSEDIATLAKNDLTGTPTNYAQLQSPQVKGAAQIVGLIDPAQKQAMGIKETPQEALGNAAGSAEPFLAAGVGSSAGGSAIDALGNKTVMDAALQGAKQNILPSAAYSATAGLDDGRNKSLKDQAIQSAMDAVAGGVTGAVGGGVLAGGSKALGDAASNLTKQHVSAEIRKLDLPTPDNSSPTVNIARATAAINQHGDMIRSVVDALDEDHQNTGASNDIRALTAQYLPKFSDAPVEQQKAIWDNLIQLNDDPQAILNDKHETVNSALKPTIDAIKQGVTNRSQRGAIGAEDLPPEQSVEAPNISSKAEQTGDANFEALKNDGLPTDNPAMAGLGSKPSLPEQAQPSEVQNASDIVNINQAEDKPGWLSHNLSMLKGTPDDFKTAFQKWVGQRQAAPLEGVLAGKKVNGFDNLGDDITSQLDTAQKSNPELISQLKELNDAQYKKELEAGVPHEGQKDNGTYGYLHQAWQQSADQVKSTFNKYLSLKPGFTKESTFPDYQSGVDAGLTPKFANVSDVQGYRTANGNKAIADIAFARDMIQKGYVTTTQEEGFAPLVNFPVKKVRVGEDTLNNAQFFAPKPLADVINNYMQSPEGIGHDVANAFSKAKRMSLSTGIPGTAVSPHGFNVLARDNFNPQTAYWMVNPHAAEGFVNDNLEKALPLVRAGMTITTEDARFKPVESETEGNLATKGLGKVRDLQLNMFEDPIFSKLIPAMKIRAGLDTMQNLTDQGIPEEDAAKITARQMNMKFGGLNYDMMATNKGFFDAARIFTLAPDWMATNIGLAKNVAQAMANPTNPEGRVYRQFAYSMMGAYVTANIANYLLSGHLMAQNDPTDIFNIDTGQTTPDGQKRYIRVFGTAMDAVRLPIEMADGIATGKYNVVAKDIRNRLSTPIGAALSIVSGQDPFGNNLYSGPFGKKLGGTQVAENVAGTLLGGAGLPPQLAATNRFLAGQTNPEQFGTQLLGLPVRYGGGAISPAQQTLVANLKAQGYSGDQINHILQARRNQKAGMQSTGIVSSPSGSTPVSSANWQSSGVGSGGVTSGVASSGVGSTAPRASRSKGIRLPKGSKSMPRGLNPYSGLKGISRYATMKIARPKIKGSKAAKSTPLTLKSPKTTKKYPGIKLPKHK